MAGIIFDGKTVSPAILVEKEIAKTKFGASVDAFLGDVDENGMYVESAEPFSLNLAGVKSVGDKAFAYKFAYLKPFQAVIANDLISVGDSAFYYFCDMAGLATTGSINASFDAIEEINENSVFQHAFSYRKISSITFKKLKRVNGKSVFDGFTNAVLVPDKVFPALEEVAGDMAFSTFMTLSTNKPVVFSKVKKITGSAAYYSATFMSYNSVIWHIPSATELSRYVFYSSGAKEIHFAAANQAAIEALPDYAIKFGATNATIYFDLMLRITVNSVVYEREHTIDGYTSWKDASGNLVYTVDTSEPAVGTVVYSDQGTTQVGTVEGVA